MEKKSSLSERYFEKPKRLKTWGGIPLKETYTPDDITGMDYASTMGSPGEFPYTRGLFPTMYRGRMWSVREISGYASPRVTNKRLGYLVNQGESALNIITDSPTHQLVDSDHPHAEGLVGREGVPICTLADMIVTTEGIPLDQVSVTISDIWAVPSIMYLGAAEKQGVALDKVRGTSLNDPLSWPCARYFLPGMPQDMALRMATDFLLFCSEQAPLFYPMCCGSVGLKESVATPPQEIGFDFCIARCYLKEAVRKGGSIDAIAPRLSFTHRGGIDIFEEAAKFRAARRVWARMMKEEFGAQNPRSLTYKVHVVTKGSDLFAQQPENNIIRIAYQALAAVLGGAQSLHTTSFDEPICLPTEESVRIALRTQQILAYETGVINVADPLGGSYYVEWLTNEIENQINEIIAEYQDNILEALASGKMMSILDSQSYQFQQEVENGERTIVGVNAFTIEEEEEREVKLQDIAEDEVREHLDNLKKVKRTRDNKKVKECLQHLRKVAESRDENLVPAVFEAVREYATLGEITGTIRMGYGYSYDPFQEIENPF